MDTPQIIKFLRGKVRNVNGLLINDIHNFDDNKLESVHNYIQWIFPLVERSENIPNSPFINIEDLKNVTQLELDEVRDNMKKSVARMSEFYSGNDHWISPYDHNHLRITRIIRSLKLFGLDKEADEFYNLEIMPQVYRRMPVSFETLEYWNNALKNK